jgi:hypothetical protein
MTDINKTIEEAKAALLPFESWERLTGETSAAYAAFCAFRDYGPERNIRRAVEEHCHSAESHTKFSPEAKTPHQLDMVTAKKYRTWRNWAAQFRWRERAADYDRYLDRIKQTEKRKTIEAQEETHRVVTGKMLAVVSKKLDLMDPADLSAGTVTEWVETAIRADREGAGLLAPDGGGAEMKQGEIAFTPEFEGI